MLAAKLHYLRGQTLLVLILMKETKVDAPSGWPLGLLLHMRRDLLPTPPFATQYSKLPFN